MCVCVYIVCNPQLTGVCSCAQKLSLVAPSGPPATAARPTKRPNKALTL